MRLRALALVLSIAAAPSPGLSAPFTESFTTTTFRDPAGTTAHWDTTAGELRLPPYTPTYRGTYDTPYSAFGVAVAGVQAFIADGLSGLQVVNFSDPANPTLTGGYDTPDQARGVTVAGNRAFVADYESGLQILDVTNPAVPVLLGAYDTPGNALAVAVAGNLAFVADRFAGLRIVDISNPASPTSTGSYDTPGVASGVALAGNLAVVADLAAGLQLLDVSSPATPALAGSHDTPGDAYGVFLAGNLAYVADGWMGLTIVDISNPASPLPVGGFDTPGVAYGVAVAGDLAFVGDGLAGLIVLNISDPADPTLVAAMDTPGDYAVGVAVTGGLALVADGTSGLQILGISGPTIPTLAGTYSSAGTPYGVAFAGSLACVADPAAGLLILDISDPANPTLAGSFDTPGYPYGVAVAGSLAFVADYHFGLQIVDIANPASPTLVGALDTPGFAYGVALSGNLAFVADGASGLQIIDISNPAMPTLAGSYASAGFVYDVAVAGGLAGLSASFAGLEIVDISNPASPVLVGTHDTPGQAMAVALAGDLAFVADHNSGLQVVNIANPAVPVAAGAHDTPGIAFDVALAGGRAFVADASSGLQILDVSNPAAPTLLAGLDTPGNAYGVAVAGDLALVADYAGGVPLVRILEQNVDVTRNVGRSLAVDGDGDVILRARLATTQSTGVSWELSADDGVNFAPVTPGAAWHEFSAPGTDLRWRSTLTWSPADTDPTVSDVTVEWLLEHGRILAITDVPDDQGGWVRIQVARSAHDFADVVSTPVTGYQLYQRVDPATEALVRTRASIPDLSAEAGAAYRSLDVATIRRLGNRTFVIGAGPAPGVHAAFPPGTWEVVGWVAATQQDTYLARVPTTGDSTTMGIDWSVYLVTTHTTTPSTWFVSAPDSGYSIDNIAPGVPQQFAASWLEGSVDLGWNPAPEPDFQYYRVYRSTDPGFLPGPATLVHQTAGTSWQDFPASPGAVYYKLTALDHAGNESLPAGSIAVSAVGGTALPAAFRMHPARPNPFRAGTRIAFDLPRDTPVSLELFDVSGRRVRLLVGEELPAGRHDLHWDGTDDRGRPVAAGVYLARLRAGRDESTRRLVLSR